VPCLPNRAYQLSILAIFKGANSLQKTAYFDNSKTIINVQVHKLHIENNAILVLNYYSSIKFISHKVCGNKWSEICIIVTKMMPI
jgi:hypothetical protein